MMGLLSQIAKQFQVMCHIMYCESLFFCLVFTSKWNLFVFIRSDFCVTLPKPTCKLLDRDDFVTRFCPTPGYLQYRLWKCRKTWCNNTGLSTFIAAISLAIRRARRKFSSDVFCFVGTIWCIVGPFVHSPSTVEDAAFTGGMVTHCCLWARR